MFGFGKKRLASSATQDTRENSNYVSENQKFLSQQKGFVVYKGEDLLSLDKIKPLVTQLESCFGGDKATFEQHVAPSLRVLAAYCQFLPASENNHHSEPLGLLEHSIQSAIAAMNYLRNCNVNFGVNPDKRAEHTLAYKLTCTLASLLHDVGKINDWEITTTTADGKVYKYSFVRSIPEFIAKTHKLKLNDVYADINDDSKSYGLPKYRILGARKGRSKKHEILGNEKKNLFISTATEELIANASYELYEDLHFYTYEKYLDSNELNVSSLISKVVGIADSESAKFWNDTHLTSEIKSSGFGNSPVFCSSSNAPEINISVKQPVSAEQAVTDTVNNSLKTKLGEEIFCPGGVQDPFTSKSTSSKAMSDVQEPTDTKIEDLFDENTPTGTNFGITPSSDTSTKASAKTKPKLTLTQEHIDHVYPYFAKALEEYVATEEMCVRINKDVANGFLYTVGIIHKDLKKDLAVFLRFDEVSQQFIGKWLKRVTELSGIDLFKGLESNGADYLTRVATILTTYGVITPSESDDGYFYINHDTYWTKNHSLTFTPCVLLKDWHIAFPEESEICLNNFEEYTNHNAVIENLEDFVKLFDLYPANKIKFLNAESSRKFNIGAYDDDTSLNKINSEKRLEEERKEYRALLDVNNAAEFTYSKEKKASAALDTPEDSISELFGNDAISEKDEVLAAAITENEKEDELEVVQEQEVPAKSNSLEGLTTDKPIIEPKHKNMSLASDDTSLNQEPLITDSKSEKQPNKSLFPQDSSSRTIFGDPSELRRSMIPQMNYFKADLEDQKVGREIQSLQHYYYFTEEEVAIIKNYSQAEKEKRILEVRKEIVDKLVDKDFEIRLFKEIDLALKLKQAYISFKIIGNKNYYAAFEWSTYNQDAKKSKGAGFFDDLITNKLVPLAVNNSKTDVQNEIEYFSCVLLDPLITEYMILAGVQGSVSVNIKKWTYKSSKTTAREMLRYFEHLVIQTPLDQKVYGYKVSGNPFTGVRVDYKALVACSNEVQSKGWESQRYQLLNLENQANPPYAWKDGKDVVVAFFKKEDLEQVHFKTLILSNSPLFEKDVKKERSKTSKLTKSPLFNR